MARGANFSAPSNGLNFICLLGYVWHHYSDMSIGVVGNDFDHYFDYICVWEIDSTK